MKIEMGKKYRTRDGYDVRILCIDASGNYPVVYEATDSAGTVGLGRTTPEGKSIETYWDLVEVKEPEVCRVHFWQDSVHGEIVASNSPYLHRHEDEPNFIYLGCKAITMDFEE